MNSFKKGLQTLLAFVIVGFVALGLYKGYEAYNKPSRSKQSTANNSTNQKSHTATLKPGKWETVRPGPGNTVNFYPDTTFLLKACKTCKEQELNPGEKIQLGEKATYMEFFITTADKEQEVYLEIKKS